MIEVTASPKNEDHFGRLMAFAQDVLAICAGIGLTPILDGSLAVFAYTQDSGLEIHDIDLNCSESDFLRLERALNMKGFDCKITDWHVLQVRCDGLKVEFGATEHWMQGIPANHEVLKMEGVQFVMVSDDNLRDLYRRGLADTVSEVDRHSQAKHRAMKEKLRLLDSIQTLLPDEI